MVDIKRAFMFPTPRRAEGTCTATFMYRRALRKKHHIRSILIHDALSMGQRGPDRAHGLKNPFVTPPFAQLFVFYKHPRACAIYIFIMAIVQEPVSYFFLQYKMARVLSGSRTRTLRAPAPISPKPMNLHHEIGFFRPVSRVLVKFYKKKEN